MCASSHFGTKAESLLGNHQRLVTIATMLVHFSPQSFNSLPQSVQTAFMELKKVEYRIAKTKELPIEDCRIEAAGDEADGAVPGVEVGDGEGGG